MNLANGTPPDASRHVGDLAQLHALGALEPPERELVEAHAANCTNCARALGEAATAVAALDDAFIPQVEPPERLGARIAASGRTVVPLGPRRIARAAWPSRSFFATAATLLFAAGLGGGALVERSSDAQQATQDSVVLATIATSHFNHVSFTSRRASAPVSKVLYARDGAWFYVIVDSATCNCRVIASSVAGERDLGAPAARGTTAALFVGGNLRPRSLELVSPSGDILAAATLVYASK